MCERNYGAFDRLDRKLTTFIEDDDKYPQYIKVSAQDKKDIENSGKIFDGLKSNIDQLCDFLSVEREKSLIYCDKLITILNDKMDPRLLTLFCQIIGKYPITEYLDSIFKWFFNGNYEIRMITYNLLACNYSCIRKTKFKKIEREIKKRIKTSIDDEERSFFEDFLKIFQEERVVELKK